MIKRFLEGLVVLLALVGCVPQTVHQDVSQWQQKGVEAAAAKEYGAAVAAFNRVLAAEPANIDALSGRANSHLLRGDYARGEQDYTQLQQLAPENLWYIAQRGLARSLLGNHEGAIADYNAVLGRQPRHVAARLSRGLSLYRLKEFGRAAADFTAVNELEPDTLPALYYRARCLVRLQDLSRAISDYGRIFELTVHQTQLGVHAVLGETAPSVATLLARAASPSDKGKTLPLLDCLARYALGKDVRVCTPAGN